MKSKLKRRRALPSESEIRQATTKRRRRKLAKKYGLKMKAIKILVKAFDGG